MSRIYVIDAVGLAKLAVIYHDKLTAHDYFTILSNTSAQKNKYLTTETCIVVAFELMAQLSKPKGMEAMMRIVQYFFDKTTPSFSIERKERAKLCSDFGIFAKDAIKGTPVHIKDAAFVAKELYPGATIIGDNHTFYRQATIDVFE